MDAANIIREVTISAVPILMAITFHEVAHGYVAMRCGDPTAKMMGRLTLNPIKHIDPIGTVLVPLILIMTGAPVFGWAKPVPVNPLNFGKLRRDNMLVSAAGPATNVALAWVSVVLLYTMLIVMGLTGIGDKMGPVSRPLIAMLQASLGINIWLAAFNLMPIPPLDGSHILESVLPDDMARQYERIAPYGMIILMVLIFTGLYKYIIAPLAGLIQIVLELTARLPMQALVKMILGGG